MAKILTGSPLSYGPTLPAAADTADGAMFYLTAAATDPANSPSNPSAESINREPGLYVFAFSQDISTSLIGDQVGQRWKQLSVSDTFVSTNGSTMSGQLIVNAGVRALQGVPGEAGVPANDNANAGFSFATDGDTGLFSRGTGWVGSSISLYLNSVERFKLDATGNGYLGSNVIWHDGNDGAGSGLDADKLDGYDASHFLSVDNHTGIMPINRGGAGVNGTVDGGIVYGSSNRLVTSSAGAAGQVLLSGGAGAPSWQNATALITGASLGIKNGGVNNANNNITFNYSQQGGSPTWVWGFTSADGGNNISTTAYNPANFNVASASRLGTLSPSVSAIADTVVVRDSGNTARFHAIESSLQRNDISEFNQINQVIVTNSVDNVLRKTSIATLKSALGIAGTGTYVAKGGDSMTGNLSINGIVLSHNDSTITASGHISAYGTVSGTTGNFNSVALQSSVSFSTGPSIAASGQTVTFTMGSANFTGDVIAYASDARLKENVTIISNALEKIGTLGGYEYDWKLEESRRLGFTPTHKHEHGLLAQEVQKVVPDAVAPAPFNSDYLTVKYERIVALLVAGMNEQQAQINSLIKEIEDLKASL